MVLLTGHLAKLHVALSVDCTLLLLNSSPQKSLEAQVKNHLVGMQEQVTFVVKRFTGMQSWHLLVTDGSPRILTLMM